MSKRLSSFSAGLLSQLWRGQRTQGCSFIVMTCNILISFQKKIRKSFSWWHSEAKWKHWARSGIKYFFPSRIFPLSQFFSLCCYERGIQVKFSSHSPRHICTNLLWSKKWLKENKAEILKLYLQIGNSLIWCRLWIIQDESCYEFEVVYWMKWLKKALKIYSIDAPHR